MSDVTPLLVVLAACGSLGLLLVLPRLGAPVGSRRGDVRHPGLVECAARIATSSSDFRSVLAGIVAAMAREGLRGASIALVDERSRLRIVAHHGRLSPEVRRATLPLGEGIMGRVAAEGRPVVVGDLDRATPWAPAHRSLGSNAEIRSIAAVPIRMDGVVIGVLEVDSAVPDRFDERDLATLAQVALTVCWSARRTRPPEVAALRGSPAGV